MKCVDPSSLVAHFTMLSDPRMEGKRRHKLEDTVTIAVTAMLCGADEWTAMEEFGQAKEAWLRQFLELPKGIPSHDTFGRVFSLIDTHEFQSCCVAWVRSMVGNIEGCTVTIDAMGCQRAIAKQIVQQGGDYLLAVKGNQEKLYDGVLRLFEEAEAVDFKDFDADVYETTEKGHGRQKTRRYMELPTERRLPQGKNWAELKTIGVVEAERTIKGKRLKAGWDEGYLAKVLLGL